MNRGMFSSASDEWETPREFFDAMEFRGRDMLPSPPRWLYPGGQLKRETLK
jgi:hypothetical protein